MRNLVIHVGYHKTATTWLQWRVFTPEHGYHQVADHTETFAHVVRPLGFQFDASALRALLNARIAETPEGHVPIISSEILSGHPFQGAREREIYAARLKQVVPDARILITIRNQMAILPSIYMQYLRRGGTMRPDAFFAGTNEPGYFGFESAHFHYDRLISLYQSLFGADCVHVITQEAMQNDSVLAMAGLAADLGNTAFTGLGPKAQGRFIPSYPEYAANALRRVNHVQRSTLNPAPIMALGQTPGGLDRFVGGALRRAPLKNWLSGRKPVSDYVQKTFHRVYDLSNTRLAQMNLPQPLDLTGYPGL